MKLIWAVIIALLASTVVVFTSGGDKPSSAQTTATDSARSAPNAATRAPTAQRSRPAPEAPATDAARTEPRAEAPTESQAPTDAAAEPAAEPAADTETPDAVAADANIPETEAVTAADTDASANTSGNAAADAIFDSPEPTFAQDDQAAPQAEDQAEPAQVTAALTNPDDTIGDFVFEGEKQNNTQTGNAADTVAAGTAEANTRSTVSGDANTNDNAASAEDVAAMFAGEDDSAADKAETTEAETTEAAATETETAEAESTEAETVGAYTLEGDTLVIEGGRWTITGSGTEDDPYVVPWDLLKAAQDSYEPRLDKEIVPEWAKHLDGKAVAVSGYMLMPMGSDTAEDLLLMRNQWDGCAIGVPPTPYSAIEITLSESIDTFSASTSMNYGTIEGTFRVDPYIVSGWLLGLYLFEDAAIQDARPVGIH